MSIVKYRSAISALATGLVFLATTAIAQDVTLQSYDGKNTVTGTLVSVQDGMYFMTSPMGEFKVDSREALCLGAICPQAVPNIGGQVEIKSTDGAIRFNGTLEEFVDGNYVVETGLGTVSLHKDAGTCTGDGCLTLQDQIFPGTQ